MPDNDDVQAKIADIDDQLRTLRGERSGLTDETGDGAEGALDSEDAAAALTNTQENDALIAALEQRRQSLVEGRG